MLVMNYWPESNDIHPCWHCRSFAGLVSEGTHADCVLTGKRRVQASAKTGCVFFERVPGVDDEPGPPALTPVPGELPQRAPVATASQAVLWAP
jgi:hypothetical protein